MNFPNLDTRRLKRLATGHFTNEPLSKIETVHSLCAYCGRQTCGVRDRLDEWPRWSELSVRRCDRFVPVLGFSILHGLDLPRWNTIRIGEAWMGRLTIGMRVCIADARAERILSWMRVSDLHVSSISQISLDHGPQNHAILALKSPPKNGIQAEMMRILRNAYGTNFAKPDRRATAIYLERDDAGAQEQTREVQDRS